MRPSKLKRMTREPRIKVGHFIIEFATPGIGHILGNAGCDFVFFDLEHSGFSFETLKAAVRFFEAADVPVIARAPSKSYPMIARACDVGAEGIMAPMVNTADEAAELVDFIKYTPDGRRGVALGIAHDNFEAAAQSVGKRMRNSNEFTTVFALVETEEGAENADAIAAVHGIDCLWVGHFDLSASLGVPGEFDHPKYLASLKLIETAARKHGRSLGRVVDSSDDGIRNYSAGYDFCCYSGDVWVLQRALTAAVSKIRAACP